MIFFIISLIAGFLTVLTPCVLPILPIVLGSSISSTSGGKKSLAVIGSLVLSVFIFTFLLRVSSAFIDVPPSFWNYLSGAIILLFGLTLIFPGAWSRLSDKMFLKSNKLLNDSYKNKDKWWGDMALGASLGPIFTTCSPTFFLILATVLPSSLPLGTVYLVAYCAGLAAALLLIAYLGQKVLLKISYLSDPNNSFKKVLGWIFVALALLIVTGIVKQIETKALNAGFVDFTKIERGIGDFLRGSGEANSPQDAEADAPGEEPSEQSGQEPNSDGAKTLSVSAKPQNGYKEFKYKEIVSPSGFVNSEPFKLADIVGKKVILLDFMTYSCINCQRTFPYLNAWYQKYKDEGLEIVGIHTPEFSFEKNIDNVRKAALQFELKFPLVLDNEYAIWNAYGNQYWPRKYLIDINGNVVYDHIGEGSYDGTEAKIVELLKERAEKLGTRVSDVGVSVPSYAIYAKSPETYFGAFRNERFGNGAPFTESTGTFEIPEKLSKDIYYLGGEWDIKREYSENTDSDAKLVFKFDAKEVYLVAEAAAGGSSRDVEIYVDGSMITDNMAGKDAKLGKAAIGESRLYHLISLPNPGEHTLEIRFKNPNTRIYAFTFG